MKLDPSTTVRYLGGPLAGEYSARASFALREPNVILVRDREASRVHRYERDPQERLTWHYRGDAPTEH